MKLNNISIIVPGGLNTDIIGMGVSEILRPGELTSGGSFIIGPGGKSRNIAQMISVLTEKNTVAMIGVSCRDPFGLWKPPIEALKENGVNIDYIKIYNFSEKKKYPGIALIPVDKKGNNQIYVLPGINNDFSKKDIDDALFLFESAEKNNGILALSLEFPLRTAIYSIKMAKKHSLKIVLDPGGINKKDKFRQLLNKKIYLIKPNIYEAEILTGIKVINFSSAKRAAQKFLDNGIEHVMITAGSEGAYFFNKRSQEYIGIPKISKSKYKDETGCGDQVMASLCASLWKGMDVVDSAKIAVVAGSIQFGKIGISPVKNGELTKEVKRL